MDRITGEVYSLTVPIPNAGFRPRQAWTPVHALMRLPNCLTRIETVKRTLELNRTFPPEWKAWENWGFGLAREP